MAIDMKEKIKNIILFNIIILIVGYLLLVDIKNTLRALSGDSIEFLKPKYFLLNGYYLAMVGYMILCVTFIIVRAKIQEKYYENLYLSAVSYGLAYTAVISVFNITRIKLDWIYD